MLVALFMAIIIIVVNAMFFGTLALIEPRDHVHLAESHMILSTYIQQGYG